MSHPILVAYANEFILGLRSRCATALRWEMVAEQTDVATVYEERWRVVDANDDARFATVIVNVHQTPDATWLRCLDQRLIMPADADALVAAFDRLAATIMEQIERVEGSS